MSKVAILNMKISFFISVKAIIETTVAFFMIFFVNSVLGYINIVRSKLIDLLNASKREESTEVLTIKPHIYAENESPIEEYDLLRPTAGIYQFNGIKINNTDNIKLLEKELITIKPITKSLHVNVSKDKSSYSIFGIIYFLGAFLALVFIIATGSIIYFKLVSEAYLDKDKYVLLKRLGMTKKEIFRATTRKYMRIVM